METHLWFIGIATAVFSLLVWFSLAREKKRSEELKRTAMMLGFSFRVKAAGLPEEDFSRLPLFQHGRKKRFKNVLEAGSGDDRTLIFDYRYRVSSGKHGRTIRQTAACFKVNPERVSFRLRPEGGVDRIKAAFGFRDINFEGYPEFSGQYHLSGENEEAVRSVFNERVLYFFRERAGWTVESGGGWLAVYREGHRTKLEDYRKFIEDVRRIRRQFE
ncbi:MAG TPA: hypothetical protein VIU33_05790 [Nitrospiria bacterium]